MHKPRGTKQMKNYEYAIVKRSMDMICFHSLSLQTQKRPLSETTRLVSPVLCVNVDNTVLLSQLSVYVDSIIMG
jgi:hypothetical protein